MSAWGAHLGLSPDGPIVVLGAGVTGLTIASELQRVSGRKVIILEKGIAVGGLGGSFSLEGVELDVGSHRIHPSYEPTAARFLTQLLGDDLLVRKRRGRICVQ